MALACLSVFAVASSGAAPEAATGGRLEELWVVDVGKMSEAERTLAATLQGLVAKDRTFRRGIWIAGGGMNAVVLDELRREGVELCDTRSVWQLLNVFADHVDGAVVCELGTDSLNVATSLCGPRRAVAVDASIVREAEAAGLEAAFDARGYDELRARREFPRLFARGVLVEQTEKKSWHLRDYAVARNAFTYYGVEPDERTRIVRDAARDGTGGALVFGWGGDEHRWVEDVSRGGGSGVPADWSTNLSVLSRLPVDIPARPRRYPAPARDGERIVAFVMSDGDNIQWMAGGFVGNRGFWASPHRGRFSMTWEMSPVLAEVAPRALRHFYRTASGGEAPGGAVDDFAAGPSGAGYCFHNHLPDRRAAARKTARYMKMSGLTVTTMLNSGGDMSQSRELLQRPEIMGVLYKDYAPYNKRKGAISWHEGKPCISYRYLLWEPSRDKSPEGVAEAVARLPASPLADQDSYAAVNVHAWSFKKIGGPMEAVKRTIDLLPPGTRVVTAEEFVILLRNSFGEPVTRDAYKGSPTGSRRGAAK